MTILRIFQKSFADVLPRFGRASLKFPSGLWDSQLNFIHRRNVCVSTQCLSSKGDANLNFIVDVIDANIEAALIPLRTAVKEQGDVVREMKQQRGSVDKAVNELNRRKKRLDEKEKEFAPAAATLDRDEFKDFLTQHFYLAESFSIYGHSAGQYDLGPLGCALKSNILSAWRRFFVLEEQMLEVDCSILTPGYVLKASGHEECLTDLMVMDLENSKCYRLNDFLATHLKNIYFRKGTSQKLKEEIVGVLKKLRRLTKDELAEVLKKFEILSPDGNEFSEPVENSLLFESKINSDSSVSGFLRPECSQGIFVNFRNLLRFNQNKLPFAAAQIGSSFRNEISPESSLVRMLEFTTAELQHFSDPADGGHPKFSEVRNQELFLYSTSTQAEEAGPVSATIGEAVESGLVSNEQLAFFMARAQQFLTKIGIAPERLRFRQLSKSQLPHNAVDCWDAECLTSYGWVKCVSCSDRSTYDLIQHSKASGEKLVAERQLSKPIEIDFIEILPNKKNVKNAFGQKEQKSIKKALESLNLEASVELKKSIETTGKALLDLGKLGKVTLTANMIEITTTKKIVHVEEFVPSATGLSFGISRIIYALLEQNYVIKKERRYLALPPAVAPQKCSVLQLSFNKEIAPIIQSLCGDLSRNAIVHRLDNTTGPTSSRLSKFDEIGIPYVITVDSDVLKAPHLVSLRDRNSTQTLRIQASEAADVVRDLSTGKVRWDDVRKASSK